MADTPSTTLTPEQRRTRGFGAMDPQRQREIASLGGRAAHRNGTAHQFDSDEAKEAGRKGGLARKANAAAKKAARAQEG